MQKYETLLKTGIEELNLAISDNAYKKLLIYLDLILKWGKVYNLVATTDPSELVVKHILDSLAIAQFIRPLSKLAYVREDGGARSREPECTFKVHEDSSTRATNRFSIGVEFGKRSIKGPNVLDVGSGAGFPGIPLAIALPEYNFVLLDSISKKTTFLNHVKLNLEINNRPPSKLAHVRKVGGVVEHRTGVYTKSHEDSSTATTNKFPTGVEFRKRSNIEVVTARIETFRFEPGFATIVTRATMTVSEMIAKTAHLCTKGGQILLMKGKYPKDELSNITNTFEVHEIKVPYLDAKRHVVRILT